MIERRSRLGFTLVELLVVIAIIGTLTGMMLPAVQSARETARRMTCTNNLRQIGLSISMYLDVLGCFPPTKTTYLTDTGVRRDRHNILTFLLPYLEQTNIYDQIDLERPWSLAANRAGTRNRVPVFLCPTASSHRIFDREYYPTDYATCYLIRKAARTKLQLAERNEWSSILLPDESSSTEFHRRAPVVPGQVFDGLSNSMMFFECAGRPCKYLRNGRRGNPKETPTEPLYNSEWADPGSGFVIDGINVTDTGSFMNNCNNNEIFSLHPGGANFLYGDGSVHFHSENIDPEFFATHFTCAAGD